MLLGKDHSKLSKRHGAVSITDYKEQGYLPEAMLNFLSLLGWSLDDKTEIMSQKEIIDNFSLKSGKSRYEKLAKKESCPQPSKL